MFRSSKFLNCSSSALYCVDPAVYTREILVTRLSMQSSLIYLSGAFSINYHLKILASKNHSLRTSKTLCKTPENTSPSSDSLSPGQHTSIVFMPLLSANYCVVKWRDALLRAALARKESQPVQCFYYLLL